MVSRYGRCIISIDPTDKTRTILEEGDGLKVKKGECGVKSHEDGENTVTTTTNDVGSFLYKYPLTPYRVVVEDRSGDGISGR